MNIKILMLKNILVLKKNDIFYKLHYCCLKNYSDYNFKKVFELFCYFKFIYPNKNTTFSPFEVKQLRNCLISIRLELKIYVSKHFITVKTVN